MKKLLLITITLVMMGTGCSKEVYINRHTEIIREKDTTSDVIVIERDKQVYERESEVVRDRQSPPQEKTEPASDSGFKTILE